MSVPKFFYLDQDVPAYMISGLSQEDEPYYCVGGVNKFLKDEGRCYVLNEKASIAALQIINTPTTYLSLKLFGNNYYGLRIPVVLCSILINLLIALFANRKGFSLLSMILLITFLSTEFYSFLFSRFYNPQVFSMLFISAIILLFFSSKISERKVALLIGFLCSFMVLGVYVYTVYVAVAFFLWYVYNGIKKRNFGNLINLCLGGIAALAMWLVYLYIVKIDVADLVNNLSAHGGGAEDIGSSEKLGVLKRLVLSFTQILSTNFFRYNLYLLAGFCLLLWYSIITFKENKASQLFVLIVAVCILQNFFINSYSFKKHIIFLPILITFFIVNSKNIFAMLITEGKTRTLVLVMLFSLLSIYYCDKLNNSQEYWAGFKYGYYENVAMNFRVFNIIIALLFILTVIFYRRLNWNNKYFKFVFILFLIPSIVLTVQQFFIKKTFYAKDALINMRSEIEQKYVLQEFSHAFQFYNNSIPLFSNYNRPLIASLDIEKIYLQTDAYAVLKSFRNEKTEYNWGDKKQGDDVICNSMDFTFIKKYKLRYYDYYLIKIKNNK